MDIDEALAMTQRIVPLFLSTLAWPEAPPFPGGVLTDWPAGDTEALALCRTEWAALQSFVAKESGRG